MENWERVYIKVFLYQWGLQLPSSLDGEEKEVEGKASVRKYDNGYAQQSHEKETVLGLFLSQIRNIRWSIAANESHRPPPGNELSTGVCVMEQVRPSNYVGSAK